MQADDALRLAARTVGRGVMLKVAAVAVVLFLLVLLFLGIISASNGPTAAFANTCGSAGLPSVDVGSSAGGTVQQQQLDNAKAIDAVARADSLPGQATLIGLMTALQESTLLNITYGDQDSVGLFQQRPSQGWGTAEQIANPKTGPAFAAQSFFEGRGGNKGLAQVPGWQSMPPGDAARRYSTRPTDSCTRARKRRRGP